MIMNNVSHRQRQKSIQEANIDILKHNHKRSATTHDIPEAQLLKRGFSWWLNVEKIIPLPDYKKNLLITLKFHLLVLIAGILRTLIEKCQSSLGQDINHRYEELETILQLRFRFFFMKDEKALFVLTL